MVIKQENEGWCVLPIISQRQYLHQNLIKDVPASLT